MADFAAIINENTEPAEEELTWEQRQRVSALYHARQVCERRGGLGNGAQVTVTDLVAVARYIIDGAGWIDALGVSDGNLS